MWSRGKERSEFLVRGVSVHSGPESGRKTSFRVSSVGQRIGPVMSFVSKERTT